MLHPPGGGRPPSPRAGHGGRPGTGPPVVPTVDCPPSGRPWPALDTPERPRTTTESRRAPTAPTTRVRSAPREAGPSSPASSPRVAHQLPKPLTGPSSFGITCRPNPATRGARSECPLSGSARSFPAERSVDPGPPPTGRPGETDRRAGDAGGSRTCVRPVEPVRPADGRRPACITVTAGGPVPPGAGLGPESGAAGTAAPGPGPAPAIDLDH